MISLIMRKKDYKISREKMIGIYFRKSRYIFSLSDSNWGLSTIAKLSKKKKNEHNTSNICLTRF